MARLVVTLAIVVVGLAPSHIHALGNITPQQADSLSAFFAGHQSYSQAFKNFPSVGVGALDPVLVTTGIHCVLPSTAESLHSVQFLVGAGTSAYRQVFSFTLSPPINLHAPEATLASLLRGRQVTQFYIWSSPAAGNQGGKVVAFHSRSDPRACRL
jgi:hypothetical protein